MDPVDQPKSGLSWLESKVLVQMHDHDLWPSRHHTKTLTVTEIIEASGVCGAEHAFSVITRFGSTWTLASPLIDAHGNFGGPMGPPSESHYTECRLSVLGALAAETDLGVRPPLPIGLICGTAHSSLQLGRDSREPEWGRDMKFSPGFDPVRTLSTLVVLLDRPDASDDDVVQAIGPPVILRTGPMDLSELTRTGNQTVLWHPTVEPDGLRHLRVSQIGPAFDVDEIEWELDHCFASTKPGRSIEGPGGRDDDDGLIVGLAGSDDLNEAIAQLATATVLSTQLRMSIGAPLPGRLRSWIRDTGVDAVALRASIEDALDQLTGRRSPPSPTRR